MSSVKQITRDRPISVCQGARFASSSLFKVLGLLFSRLAEPIAARRACSVKTLVALRRSGLLRPQILLSCGFSREDGGSSPMSGTNVDSHNVELPNGRVAVFYFRWSSVSLHNSLDLTFTSGIFVLSCQRRCRSLGAKHAQALFVALGEEDSSSCRW